tara:strand:+ start:27742 stop:27849 length:108 start_codon:yes stop_codon:yes gene_type:complete
MVTITVPKWLVWLASVVLALHGIDAATRFLLVIVQ